MTLSRYIKESEYLGPAFVRAEIYFLGQFPGIIPGDRIVFGELYEVSERMLASLDKIEEYHPDDLERSSYIRKELNVTCLPNRERLIAEAYFYNRSVEGQEHITHGDYRRFINENEKESCWVINSLLGCKTNGFFNGLNNVSDTKKVKLETVNGLKANGTHGTKLLDVSVMKLKREQILKLDNLSDVPVKYSKVSVPFIDENGKMQLALTYYSNPIVGVIG